MRTELETVPSFVYYLKNNDDAIMVSFYNDCVKLTQGEDRVYIHNDDLKVLFKTILKERP